ncbi:MAG: hypothetical protein IVW56_00780 [Candidatus Binataceae bacterium]|nr:hypothetical protein [Candidatus Binataceae bacterium]
MKSIVWLGALFALLGILGLVIPEFSTSHTRDVVNLGAVKVQSTEKSTHMVPPALGAGVLILGVILIGGGLYQRR